MGTRSLIRSRREELRQRLDVARKFEQFEESCVPSYIHPNPAAAGVAWMRLLRAAGLYRRFAPQGPILDFGAATGEVFHVLKTEQPYEFCELNEVLIRALMEMNPKARRVDLHTLERERYAAIFALDSLEHNDNVGELLDLLIKGLRRDGVLILSGPTENWIYKTGRKIAGFSGHYHKTTIGDIEKVAQGKLTLVHRGSIPFGVPLFSLSVWKRA